MEKNIIILKIITIVIIAITCAIIVIVGAVFLYGWICKQNAFEIIWVFVSLCIVNGCVLYLAKKHENKAIKWIKKVFS